MIRIINNFKLSIYKKNKYNKINCSIDYTLYIKKKFKNKIINNKILKLLKRFNNYKLNKMKLKLNYKHQIINNKINLALNRHYNYLILIQKKALKLQNYYYYKKNKLNNYNNYHY